MAEIICLNDGGFVVNLGDTKEFLERLLREKLAWTLHGVLQIMCRSLLMTKAT